MNAAQLGDNDLGIEMKLFLRVWSGAKAIDRGVVAQQQVDAGSDATTHDIEIISPLLHHYQATIAERSSKADDHFRELRKTSRRKIHLAERVIPVCVKASRYQDQLWIKAVGGV